MPRQKGQHTWYKLNKLQWRCNVCGILRNQVWDKEKKASTYHYQDNESKIHTQHITCPEKYDDSEFYNTN